MNTTTTACRARGCWAPAEADHATLHTTSDTALLTALLGLTHRIQTAEQERGRTQAQVDHVAMLRARRDLARDEILRRMCDAR
jgi:hypothetical protein